MKKITDIILLIILLGLVDGQPYFDPDLDLPKYLNLADMEIGTFERINTVIKNKGTTGSAKCELGLYHEDTIKEWFDGNLPGYLFSIGPYDSITANCPTDNGQPWPAQMSKEFLLQTGVSEQVIFEIPIPIVIDPAENWVVYVGCFNQCYREDPGAFQWYGVDSARVNVFGNNQPPEDHCVNLIKDRDESATDCGGVDCAQCDNGITCLKDSDCKSGYCGMGNRCEAEPPIEPPNEDDELIKVPFVWLAVIVVIIGAIIAVLVSGKR